MSGRRHGLPGTPWIDAMTVLAAVAVAVLGFRMLDPGYTGASSERLDGPITAPATAALERSWIEAALPEDPLPTPPGPPPCLAGLSLPDGLRRALEGAYAVGSSERLSEIVRDAPDRISPALALASRLIDDGRVARAEDVLARLVARPSFRAALDRAKAAARAPSGRGGASSTEALAVVHALHAYGYVQLAGHGRGDALWPTLKNPIGVVRLLARRGVTGEVVDAPTWAEHRLPSPGCPPGDGEVATITSLDLYNNLIVGYLQADAFAESASRRAVELRRDYDEPATDNPLQAVLRRATAQDDPALEHWVWAVSNAERLLRERRLSRYGPPTNPRLALNLAQIALSARAWSLLADDAPARAALVDLAATLTGPALGSGARASGADQQERLERVRARVAGLVASASGQPLLVLPGEEGLRGTAKDAIAAVRASLAARTDPESRLAAATGDEPIVGLGDRSASWRAALRSDLAAAVADLSPGTPVAERTRAVRRARRILRRGDAVPDTLAALVRDLGIGRRMGLALAGGGGFLRVALAGAMGAVVLLVGAWWRVQWRRRKALFTSFYRREARARVAR